MPIGDTLGGFIRPGYNPLLVTDAPTIGVASTAHLAVSIAFTAPSDVGGGAITSYTAVATDTATAASFTATGTSTPISITGLTEGQSYTTTVTAINAYGPSGISAASNSVTAVSALELWTWGYNNKGQLGHGNITNLSSPVQVGVLTTWTSVTNGYLHTAGITQGGTIWTWGQNNHGQLGLNNATLYSSPKQVGALTTWLNVSAGNYHCAAIKTDGTLWAWGFNSSGQLGQNNTTYQISSPVQIGSLTDWLTVSAGYANCAAIKTDGTLWTWGVCTSGALGHGNTTNRSSPVQVGALTTWSQVTSNKAQMMAVKTDGTLWVWGSNNEGQLGLENTTNYSSPVQVGGLTTWLSITAGETVSAAIITDGTMWGWGFNGYGQIGDGTTVNKSSPVQVGALTDWDRDTGIGARHSLVHKSDGTLWAWGNNGNGELGQGNTTATSSPVQVGALTTWVQWPIDSGFGYRSSALKGPS